VVLQSILCEIEHNDTCISEGLSKLLDADPRVLGAYLGLAKLENRKGNKKGALEWVNRGLGLTSTYIPLQELKNSFAQ
jgi:hypothetical protein